MGGTLPLRFDVSLNVVLPRNKSGSSPGRCRALTKAAAAYAR